MPRFLIFFLLSSNQCWVQVLLQPKQSLAKLHTSTIRLNYRCDFKCLFLGVPVYACGCSYAQWNNDLIHRVVPSIVTDFSCYTLLCFAENWEFQGSYCFSEPMSGGTCTLFCKWNQDQAVTQPVLRPSLMTSLLSQHQEIVQEPQVSSRNPTPVQIKSRKESPFPRGSFFLLAYSSQPPNLDGTLSKSFPRPSFTFIQWGPSSRCSWRPPPKTEIELPGLWCLDIAKCMHFKRSLLNCKCRRAPSVPS